MTSEVKSEPGFELTEFREGVQGWPLRGNGIYVYIEGQLFMGIFV